MPILLVRVYRGLGRACPYPRQAVAEFLFGAPQIVGLLQIHPEYRAGAEVSPESERGVRGDAACAVQDTGDAVRRYADIAGKLRSCDTRCHNRVREVLARMDRATCHGPYCHTETGLSILPDG